MVQEGLLIVISGPSGVGKGTVCKELLKVNTNLELSTSMTTREPRVGETEGADYFFVSHSHFQKLIEEDSFLEWAEVHDNCYGTLKAHVNKQLKAGKDIILEIDTQGARQVKRRFPEGTFIFLLPPSMQELERRIINRGTESKEKIMSRLKCAKEEVKAVNDYDYVVVNKEVNISAAIINSITEAEKSSVIRNKFLINSFLEEEV